ncbi:hypothetical protein QQ045_019934 [Rhodiola kirilowii]
MDYSSDSEVESSEVLQGSESGWTMYLNSPTYASQDDQSSFDEKKKDGFSGGADLQDDDSMASDASSGPCWPDTADCDSPKRHYNVQDATITTTSPKISCMMMKKNIRREERLRRQVNHSQKLVSNAAATSFSHIRCRNKVTKNNVG